MRNLKPSETMMAIAAFVVVSSYFVTTIAVEAFLKTVDIICDIPYRKVFKMILRLFRIVLVGFLGFCVWHFGSIAYKDFKEERTKQFNESKCVDALISKGYERIDIYTGNGTCHYMKNGYYK